MSRRRASSRSATDPSSRRPVAWILPLVATLLRSAQGEAEAAEPAAPAGPKPIQVTVIQRTSPVDFEKEVLPILRTSCLACHNRTKAKADLVLETPADILKGGESGPAVVPRKGAESLLLKVSAHQVKPFMPPKDNKVEAVDLQPEQLGLLQLWIDQGATGEVRGERLVVWESLPPGVNPILSVAMSANGQVAACGRANQLTLYHLPTRRLLDRLTDPELIKSGLYTNPGVAHRDMVNALDFAPDGSMLASGDYRAVKLWQRRSEESRRFLQSTSGVPATAIAVLPGAQRIVTGDATGHVTLWNAATGAAEASWPAHGHGIVSLGVSPEGN
ncbi:MAG TPA: hypothetical protein DCM86_06855, partial [Verrucomicrobiales bacterium]|nr:hypothetical protein [Verrucomicrobiales bacterium]